MMMNTDTDVDQCDGPLSGVTVLDASRVLSGPFCTMQLGDLGADVIKIERPEAGDQTRSWHPPTYGDSDEAAYYLSANRNKRSMTLNLANEEGREIFRTLAADADVLVENFRVGKMATWNLDYETLSAENSDLVYCSISGYGQTGPHRERPAYDLIMQAEAGLMSITGEKGQPPVRVGVAIADIGAGMYATQAILAALFRREFADEGGQYVDVSLFEGLVAWQTYMASYYFATGDPPGRMGSKHPTIAPYQAFPTADGYIVVAVPSPNLWPKFCAAIDREDLIDDERFETNDDRVTNRAELDTILEAEFTGYTTAEAEKVLDNHGVPASSVHDMADVFNHEQVEARGMRRSIPHPTAGEVQMPGSPMNLSRTPTDVARHPPRLGEHTDEILVECGYDAVDIERYHENDVV
jgi:crotonobetainyl-CoA:carnitine CoA-transferase CaiB-like acyl-CoA transferase